MKENNPYFVYKGSFSFDLNTHVIPMVEYEKKKYKFRILKEIKELEEEILQNKKDTLEEKKRTFKFWMQKRSNYRSISFEYENGDIYPKDVDFPDIRLIQAAEPHVGITDLYDQQRDWYNMPELIRGFSEEAYLTYELGLWLSSIAAAINCCEYLLKYEYFREINKADKRKAEQESLRKDLSLGSFMHSFYLNIIGSEKFKEKIIYLNEVRISIYHFSPDREREVNKKGEIEIEKNASISDHMVLPIIAFRVYSIMMEIINHFYNKEKALEYAKECAQDWMKKRGLKEDEI